jgi:hypothetical protein
VLSDDLEGAVGAGVGEDVVGGQHVVEPKVMGGQWPGVLESRRGTISH